MLFRDSLRDNVGVFLLLPVTLPVYENLLGAAAHEDVEQKSGRNRSRRGRRSWRARSSEPVQERQSERELGLESAQAAEKV